VRFRLGWWPLVPFMLVAVWMLSGRTTPDLAPSPSMERAITERAAERIRRTESEEPKPPHVVGAARVIDGDTLEVAGTRIRLEGISAPEMNERGGSDAKSALAALIGKWEVYCALSGYHSGNREVAVCFPERGSPIHGIDLGGRMVSEGWALPCPRFSRAYNNLPPPAGLVQRLGYVAPAYCAP
jgi:endonuclease YncB( thermonuclease family)